MTKQGYMIIYCADEKGYVVDIPESMKVTTSTTTLKARDLGGVTTTLVSFVRKKRRERSK